MYIATTYWCKKYIPLQPKIFFLKTNLVHLFITFVQWPLHDPLTMQTSCSLTNGFKVTMGLSKSSSLPNAFLSLNYLDHLITGFLIIHIIYAICVLQLLNSTVTRVSQVGSWFSQAGKTFRSERLYIQANFSSRQSKLPSENSIWLLPLASNENPAALGPLSTNFNHTLCILSTQ